MFDWSLLEEVFTVETLMTPRPALYTQDRDRVLDESQPFDLVPVTEDEKIVGVFVTNTNSQHALTRDWLISADTSVPHLVDLFVDTGKPGFLVLQRQEIVGVVTPADLNKMPARAYLYHIIGRLETMLSNWIDRELQPDEITATLSKKRREKVIENHSRLVEGNVDVKIIETLYLSDLISIVEKRQNLREKLGYPSRNAANRDLGGLNGLRNKAMHPVNPILRTLPEDLVKLHERVLRTREVLEKLKALSPKPAI
jgi:hypothetical protein